MRPPVRPPVRPVALAAVVLALTAVPAAVVAPTAHAAEPCTPSIAMPKPVQDPGGFMVFSATYTVCESTRVTIKLRDRDAGPGWGGGSSTVPAGSATTYAGTCHPDGQPHRWVAYATLKTPVGGVLIAETAKVYFKSKPVSRNCAPWSPPAT